MIATLAFNSSSFSCRGFTNCLTLRPAVAILGGGGSEAKKESQGEDSLRENEERRIWWEGSWLFVEGLEGVPRSEAPTSPVLLRPAE